MTNRVKLAHVALAAGVSEGTASEALRGKGRVSDATRERVLREAKRLGYQPDPKARSLRAGGLRMVGYISDIPALLGQSDRPRWFWPKVLTAFTAAMTEKGIGVSLLSSSDIEKVERLPVDGLVYVSIQPENNLPVDLINRLPTYFVSLATDHVDSSPSDVLHELMKVALDHLLEQGARRPAMVALSKHEHVYDQFDEGYRRWCAGNNMPPLIIEAGTDGPGAAIGEAHADGVDAFFTLLGDAAEVLEGCHDASVKVPEDALLIALGEGSVEQHLDPPVTTVSLRGELAGKRLAEVVIELIETGQAPDFEPPWELQQRASTQR